MRPRVEDRRVFFCLRSDNPRHPLWGQGWRKGEILSLETGFLQEFFSNIFTGYPVYKKRWYYSVFPGWMY